MASFERMIQKDLELLWNIQDFCYRKPWINHAMAKIVSKYPWKDVVIIIWVFFTIGVCEYQSKHFWVVMMNLAPVVALNRMLEAKRPVEYDNRLQPITDLNSASYGFPSVESYMSVVIMGHLSILIKSIFFLPVAILVIFITGFSRVYSRSRFPHQIVGSWIFGIAGLFLGMDCCQRMKFHAMGKHDHIFCVGFVVICLLCNLALNIENNDSQLIYIKKSEFIDVMRNIISGGGEKADAMMKNESDDEDYNKTIDIKNNSERISTNAKYEMNSIKPIDNDVRQRRRKVIKSDSLYYLQKSIMEREQIVSSRYNLNDNSNVGSDSNVLQTEDDMLHSLNHDELMTNQNEQI